MSRCINVKHESQADPTASHLDCRRSIATRASALVAAAPLLRHGRQARG